jgi:hypothetical protein
MGTSGRGTEKIEDSLRILNDRMRALDRRIQMLTEALEEKSAPSLTNYREIDNKEPME